ncbi:7694_t:CDS:2, partial [Cetraspora pellucida]
PPESVSSKYDIVMDAISQKSYLRHYNCNHKIEITSDTMISSYKTLNPNYVMPTYSADDIFKISNLHGQTEESYASGIVEKDLLNTSQRWISHQPWYWMPM